MNFLKIFFSNWYKVIARFLYAIVGVLTIILVVMDFYHFLVGERSLVYETKYGVSFGFTFLLVAFLMGLNLLAKSVGYARIINYFKNHKK